MEAFLTTTPLWFCLVGSDNRVVSTSIAFSNAVGYAPGELKGADVSILEPVDRSFSVGTTVKSCRDGMPIRGSRIYLRKKDGGSVEGVVLSWKWQSSDDSAICAIAIVDPSFIPEIKKDAEIISELRRKESLKDEFIAVASHELRTPIQPMLGLALLAKRGKISQDEAWERVLKEARRLQQLANDILDVSRIESGSLGYKTEKIRIVEIVEHVVGVNKAYENENLQLRLSIDEDATLIECELDRARITQALMNVVGNAMKFAKKGEVLVEVKLDKKHARCDLVISDTAGGIPEAMMPILFTKFSTRKVGEDESHGSGLGLYITKAIVNAHKGVIYACNNEKGATVVIRLPISQSGS
jgi:PAS domain S-box-containing protein